MMVESLIKIEILGGVADGGVLIWEEQLYFGQMSIERKPQHAVGNTGLGSEVLWIEKCVLLPPS